MPENKEGLRESTPCVMDGTESSEMAISVVGSRGHLAAHEGLEIVFRGKTLNLVLTLESDQIAPLFDGAAWAGTQLWDAAILMVRYMGEKHLEQLRGGARVLELGCGTGVPGMCCRVLGGDVVLTEQPQLVPLLQKNIGSNFPGDTHIQACELSWSSQAARSFHQNFGSFDFVLACDCVYPPVYGDSWILLVDTFHELLTMGGKPTILLSWERRKGDKMDEFLAYCGAKSPAIKCERLLWEPKSGDGIGIHCLTLATSD